MGISGEIQDLGEGQYLVPSKSREGLYHKVNVHTPSCQCEAFQYRGGCSHLKEISAMRKDLGHDKPRGAIWNENEPVEFYGDDARVVADIVMGRQSPTGHGFGPVPMFTTRYANKQLASAAVTVVQTSRGKPKFHLPYGIDEQCVMLMPDYWMLRLETNEEFEREYRGKLIRHGASRIRAFLENTYARHKKPLALMCFENVLRGEFCHRRIFAEWWFEQTQEEIPELSVEEMLSKYGFYEAGDRHDPDDLPLFPDE